MRCLIAVLLVIFTAAPAAAAKRFSAERFDSRIRVLAGGNIEVVETVVFRFEDGTFDHVFREIPSRRTDGIEITGASMDGRDLQFGKQPGQVEVQRGSPVKVRWRFAPRSGTSHTFVLTYIVRGVVKRDANADVLDWIALPTRHDYRIDTSEVVIETPSTLASTPHVEVRRVAEHSIEPADAQVQVVARTIGKNGWIRTRLAFPEGSVIAAAPGWQQRQLRADASAPTWWTAAAVVFGAGVMLLIGLRQRYDRPARYSGSPAFDGPPDNLRPALAGALASNGSISLQHAMATLFELADRGIVTVEEESRRWGQHRFTIRRNRSAAPLMPEESALLDLAFPPSDRSEDGASLTKVRSRIASGIRKYRERVQEELRAKGLLDEDRMRVRKQFLGWGLALMFLALLLIVPSAVMADEFGGWPFLVPASVAIVALGAFINLGSMTPLSNEGVRRADEWRAYSRHLKEVARDRATMPSRSPASILPFAVALGLAGQWSKFVKTRPDAVPSWFRTLTANDSGAFPAFIAVGGAGDHGGAGGGAGAGGAAGGGASGAG
jgi:hypothetical protein